MAPHDEVERELQRVVDRLTSMPLAKAVQSQQACLTAGEVLLRETRRIDPDVPDAPLPTLGPQGLGAMIAVLGRDYLAAARHHEAVDDAPVVEALVALRRSLP